MNSFWKLLDAYARTTLIDYQEYRRYCLNNVQIQLQQIHWIYQMSHFQGYSIVYRFDNNEQVELFIRLMSLDSQRSTNVTRFEVHPYDFIFIVMTCIDMNLDWHRIRCERTSFHR
jgi:hypothetical protein